MANGRRVNMDFWELLMDKLLPVLAGIALVMAIVLIASMILKGW